MRRLQIISLRLLCAVFSRRISRRTLLYMAAFVCGAAALYASDADMIGLTAMRRERPTITGMGIPVAQPESQENTNAWEASPYLNLLPTFTWTSDSGTTTNFPNIVGLESGHADGVGYQFYSLSSGVAPGVSRVDSYDAQYFFDTVITNNRPMQARVINQSFIFSPSVEIDASYDHYAATYNVLFVSGMNSNDAMEQCRAYC
jgi:hypothetical protein